MGKPGMFPSFKGTDMAEREGGTFILDLYDPFGFSKNASPERKARQLRAEINNGRLAMLAIIAFVSASQVPGSVPLLKARSRRTAAITWSPFRATSPCSVTE